MLIPPPPELTLPEKLDKYFKWIDTMPGNVKNSIVGTYHSIHSKQLPRYLAEFCYRFNGCFDLGDLLYDLIDCGVVPPPINEKLLQFRNTKG